MSSSRVGLGLLLVLMLALAGSAVWFWIRSQPGPAPSVEHATVQTPAEPSRRELAVEGTAPRELASAPAAQADTVLLHVWIHGTKAPVAGASIDVLSLASDAEVEPLLTARDGTVRVPLSRIARSKLRITAEGCFPSTREIGELAGDSLEIELCAQGRLRVHVFDTRHVPARGALVSAFLARSGVSRELRESLTPSWPEQLGGTGNAAPLTDAEGLRRLEGLPCGVPLLVTASNTIPATALEATIDPERREAELEIVAQAPCCLHGRLVWEDKSPVDPRTTGDDELRIMCLDSMPDPNTRPFTRCGENGEFTFCDLPKGRVNWRIEWPGELSRCTTLAPGTNEVGDIVLHHTELVRGRVYLSHPPEGLRYTGIGLVVWQQGRCVGHAPLVQPDGRFELRLPPGLVRIDLATNRDPLGSFEREIPCGELALCLDALVGRLRIRNLALERSDVYLRLASVGDEPRARFDGALVARQYSLGGTESRIGWQGADLCGWFLPPGTYEAFAGTRKRSSLVALGRATIAAGEECVLDAATPAVGRIRGTVATAKGEPVRGTSISACPQAFVHSAYYDAPRARSDPRGEFVFDALPAGSWRVFPSSGGPDAIEARSIELAGGGEASVRVELEATGALEGSVKRHGQPEAGTTLSLFARSDLEGLHRPPQLALRSDAEGRFRFLDLVPGEYSLSVYSGEPNASDRRHMEQNVLVRSGQTISLPIDLDFALTRIDATRDGAPFTAIDDGYVAGPAGLHRFERLSGGDPGWGARVTDGPCLFLFSNKEIPVLDWPPTARGYLIAYVPLARAGQSQMQVAIGTCSLVVRLRDPGTPMPTARLESVGELRDVAQYFAPATLAGLDEGDGRRRFVGIPPGSSVTLESARWLLGPVAAKRVDLGTRTEVEILWPPE